MRDRNEYGANTSKPALSNASSSSTQERQSILKAFRYHRPRQEYSQRLGEKSFERVVCVSVGQSKRISRSKQAVFLSLCFRKIAKTLESQQLFAQTIEFKLVILSNLCET